MTTTTADTGDVRELGQSGSYRAPATTRSLVAGGRAMVGVVSAVPRADRDAGST